MHAVAPHLNDLKQQNAQLQQRLAVESRRRLDSQVAQAVPNYQEIDRDPRWHRYLLGVDTLSGRVRQTLPNEAIASGDANRVAAFFRAFQTQNPTGATQAAPAPSRAATSSQRVRDYGRPTYTGDQISKLYRRHQQGAYNGRESEWARQEADIIAAGREGRILGAITEVTGK